MATTPRVDTNGEVNFNIEPKAFGAKLSELAKHHNNLMKLAASIYSLGKTQRLQFPNGDIIGRKEIRSLSSQFVKELKGLKKFYVARGRKKKRTRKPGTTAGFKNPILVSDNMREFFAVANLGPSDPRNPQSEPLNKKLAVGMNGVTTRAIMTPVFNIYAHVNRMQKDPENKQFLTATPEMDQYFKDTYRRLEAQPQRYAKADKDGVRKPIPKFSPQRFRYASIQQIVADNSVPKPDSKDAVKKATWLRPLNAEQQLVLDNVQMKERLKEEQVLVSGILEYYRWQKATADGKTKKPFQEWAVAERAKKAKRKQKASQ